jgi:hypothetical protein
MLDRRQDCKVLWQLGHGAITSHGKIRPSETASRGQAVVVIVVIMVSDVMLVTAVGDNIYLTAQVIIAT